MIAAVILAAGGSNRLGEPKQLVRLSDPGETLLERAVRVVREAGAAPVVVVLGCEAASILAQSSLGDAVTVVNGEWAEGMASSIRLGVATCRLIATEAKGILLMTCDQPAITAEHLRLLAGGDAVTASAYAGRRGVPAYFPAASLGGLMGLRGDAGARELLRSAAWVELPNGELDIDTAEELARARELFR